MKKETPIPAQELPVIDPTPIVGRPNSPSNRCLFLAYRTTSGRDFPTIIYLGEDHAVGREIAEKAAKERGYLLVQGFRNFEASPVYRRQFPPVAVEPELAGKV